MSKLSASTLAYCGIIAGLLVMTPVCAKTFGLVVGIDQYQKAERADFPRLQGAVNDAKLLAETLRDKGVDLPENRVLLNGKATLANFKSAWQSILDTAMPSDQIIFTFAGHGSWEYEFAEPRDEADHKDETLLFYDFDPTHPIHGRISDDELYALFEQARRFNILFVADTCHSGGMTRSAASYAELPQRGRDGPLGGFTPLLPVHDYTSPASDDSQVLSHVTYLSATQNESLSIGEIAVGGLPHGALSWAFSQAYNGAADSDGNKHVSLRELEGYVTEQVRRLTDNRQFPGMLPRGNDQDAFLAAANPAPPPPPPDRLAINVIGGKMPQGLLNVRLVDRDYRLRFALANGKATVFNPHGDQVAEVDAATASSWSKLIAKFRLLDALDHAYNTQAKPVKISLKQGDDVHNIEQRLDFSFDPDSASRHLLLFDLAGTGELQFLYPLTNLGDKPALAQIPYALSLDVVPPTGEDDLVAVFCNQPQDKAIAVLNTYNGKAPPEPETLLQTLGKDCQIGRYAFFTRN